MRECPSIEDRITNTMSLWRERAGYSDAVSRTVIERLLKETVATIKNLPSGVLSLKRFFGNLIFLGAAVLILLTLYLSEPDSIKKAVYGIGSSIMEKQNRYIKVITGDKTVEKGGGTVIEVLTNSSSIPQIEIARLGQTYREVLVRTTDFGYQYEM